MGLLKKLHTLCNIWDTKRLIKNIRFFQANDIDETLIEVRSYTIEDCVFELEELRNILLPLVPSVLNKAESLSLLRDKPKSLARFGDGEIAIMHGKDIPFQKYDAILAEKMLKVLQTSRDDLYVGISDYFHALSPDALTLSRSFHRHTVPELRRFILKNANPEIRYLHASCFTGYFDAKDDQLYGKVSASKRQLFAGKDIVLVAGKSVFSKLEHDVFELAASKTFIEAPSIDAFQEYSSILDEITRHAGKDSLICLILGPTATAMASDLTDAGYMAWDVGHIAKDYDAFMKKTERSHENHSKFWQPD